jgi:ribosome-binding protein aMBF1 (putative translation factor)
LNPDTTYIRTLKRAIEAIGSEAKLAEQLRTSPDVLRKWLSGELQPPSKAYLAALEIARLSITQRIPKRSLRLR